MKPHESPRTNKNQFVAIRAIRGLCGIGVLGGVQGPIFKFRKNTVCCQYLYNRYEIYQTGF